MVTSSCAQLYTGVRMQVAAGGFDGHWRTYLLSSDVLAHYYCQPSLLIFQMAAFSIR